MKPRGSHPTQGILNLEMKPSSSKQQKTSSEPRKFVHEASPPTGKLSDISGDLAVTDTPMSSQQDVVNSDGTEDSMDVSSPEIPPVRYDQSTHYDPFVLRVPRSPLVQAPLPLLLLDDTDVMWHGKRLDKGKQRDKGDMEASKGTITINLTSPLSALATELPRPPINIPLVPRSPVDINLTTPLPG
jgi:hypothetical protein